MAKANSKNERLARHKAAVAAAKKTRAEKRARQRANPNSSRARRLARRAECRATIASVAEQMGVSAESLASLTVPQLADMAKASGTDPVALLAAVPVATPAQAESLVDALAMVADAAAGASEG